MVFPGHGGKPFIWLAALAASLCLAQAQSPFVSGAWCGNVTPTSATVSIRLTTTGVRVRLGVTASDKLSPVIFSAADTTVATNGNVVSLDVNGLTPNTEYDFGFEVAGVTRTEASARGHFHTFPQGAASFKMAFASCGDFRDPDQRAFDAILAEQPLLFIDTGDLHYSDTNTTNAEDYRRSYDSVLSHSNQGPVFRSMATAYMWDDHDFAGGDNSNGTAIGGPTARTVYKEYTPHYPITVAGGTIAQSFTVGRVRVIMTDLRSAATPSSQPETATKSRMGAAQKAWFKQELLTARDAAFPLILWVSPDPWIDRAEVGADTWGGYATERTEIANFIKENRIKNIVILSGDMHALAYDDGTHSDYAIGGGAPIVVLQAATLTREGNIKGGPYTAGPFTGPPQYGILEVTDTGGPTVQCRFTGKHVGEGAKLVFQFSASAAAIDTRIQPLTDTTDRALINISARGRITAPSDTVIAGFVIGGHTQRRVLLRAVGPSLSAFGVTDAVPRPVITLFNGATVVASNSDWSLADVARLNDAFDRVGAFHFLSTSSHDAAILVTLDPGAYTMQTSSLTGATGSMLVEAYEVP
jgi:phosphodiesterase/alkaline phosphatase D-like protein